MRRFDSCCCLAIVACAALGGWLAAAEPQTQPATQPSTQPATRPSDAARAAMILSLANERLAAAKNELAAISADIREGPEALRRTAIQKRVSLLEEWLTLNASLESLATRKARAVERLQATREELASLAGQTGPATAPAVVTQDGFEAIRQSITQHRDRIGTLQATITTRRARMSELPRLIADARKRAESTDKQAEQIAAEAPDDPAMRKVTEARLDALRTERYAAMKQAEVLQAEVDAEPVFSAMRAAELELAEKQLERLDQSFAAYSQALKQALAREQQERQGELSRRQQDLRAADTPAERFVAQLEADIALAESNRTELSPLRLSLQTEVAEQERRLAAERDEFASLQEFLKVAGASRYATERIKQSLEQIRYRRAALRRDMEAQPAGKIDDYRSRRFELDQVLLLAGDNLRTQREQIIESLDGAERAAFAAATAKLLDRYRTSLREERDVLIDVLASWQQLQLLHLDRLNRQDDLESFIRATAFWLRDGKPLSLALLPQLWRETAELAEWAADLVSETMVDGVVRAARSPLAALYAALLFPILPILLFAARQRLRRLVTQRNQQTLDLGASVANRIIAIIVGILSAAIFPAYFFFASNLVATAGLPPAVGPVAAGLLQHISYFLFMWFLSRTFFGGRSIAQVQLGMPVEAAQAIHRSLRMTLLAYLTLLLPWILFRQPPFEFETMPRLGYTGFEIVAALAVLRLIRTRSPFMCYAFAETDNHLVKRHWRTINGIIALLLAGIIVLDMAGYRYGAANLAASFVKSLVTMIAILPLYAAARAMLATFAAQRRWTEPPSEEAIANRLAVERRIRQAVRLAFIIVSVWLLAGYWGLNLSALKTLDNIHLYTIRSGDTQEFLTAADIVRFALIVTGTVWMLWALPGIYEFAVFPRLKLDEGLKYAILTISRYAIFGVGVVMALSATHLDLGRLGWLMAAMGVGLGFGLQEIVSNFVSGIILLVERPIQVGDVVTVGSMSGTVKRINIRATTIVNFDRQEVIVPNRSLITSDVINWTHGDTVNRLVIKIGAAYGSDVDKVASLLQRIATGDPGVLADPAPQVVFMNHGESSLDFEVRIFVATPAMLVPVRDRVNKAINRQFAAEGIEIPFPQRDLHIRSSDIDLSALAAGANGAPAGPKEVTRS